MTVVLVTGASGFIGSHLVQRCLHEGYDVKALVRKGNACIAGLQKEGVEVVEGDIRDAAAVNRAVKGCDLVFHVAALTSDWGDLKDFTDINIGGTRHAVTLLASRAVVDASKARRVLGWLPKVGLEEGIRRTLDWLVSVDPSEWKVK